MLYIKQREKPTVGTMVGKITFTPGKNVYVRLGAGRKFGPQTGPLKGLRRITESGYSLSNNVTNKDIKVSTVQVKQ